jgi:hypothetical protein
MARGTLVGSLFLHACCLVCCILMNLSGEAWSTWLMQNSRIYEDFCLSGEGVWLTNIRLSTPKTSRCSEKLASVHAVDAVEYYCSPDSTLPEMCSYVRPGRAMLVLGFIAVVAAFVCSLWLNWSHTETLDAKIVPLKLCIMATLWAVLFHVVLISLMGASPLFSPAHLLFLGRNNPVNYYNGLGCVFQSPFVNGLSGLLAKHHSQECVYPGPALLFVCGVIVFSGMALLMLGLLLRKVNALDPAQSQRLGPCAKTTSRFVRVGRRWSLALGGSVASRTSGGH